MKLKTTLIEGVSYAVLDAAGLPVYIHDDGKEAGFDAAGTAATISRLNGEAKGHRERAERAEAALKPFDGIADAEAAKKALQTVANLDDKKLVDAGQVDTIKAEAIKAVEERYAPVVAERDKLKGDLHQEKIGGAFARSKFIADKAAVPADIIESRFGNQFKIEDGQVVAYDAAGNKLFSRTKPGEVAGFEEALELIVESYPYKEHILKGTGHSGSGAQPGSGPSGLKNPWKQGADFSLTEQDRIAAKDPALAGRLKAEAGV